MASKYALAVEALKARAAVAVVEGEWSTKALEVLSSSDPNSPQRNTRALYRSFGGQVAQWVQEYLGARVSLGDVIEDIGRAGVSHNPSRLLRPPYDDNFGDETSFRAAIGPTLPQHLALYNSYFDEHDVDLIILPAAYSAPPTLAQTADGTVPIESSDGSTTHLASVWPSVYPHNEACKSLHIPKLSVPTGMSADGRPTGIQLWGRALPYEEMFDDASSTRHSVTFLHLAAQAVEAIHADADLRRVPPIILVPPPPFKRE